MLSKEKTKIYLKKKNYEEIENLTRSDIENNEQNGESYYYFFLAQNKDYSGMDFDKLVGAIYYNKALELGNKRQQLLFDSEFNFYKALSPTLRKLFCYSCRENVDDFYEELKNLDEKGFEFIKDVEDDFYDNLDYVLPQYRSEITINLNFHLLNVIYIKTQNETIYHILKEFEKENNSYKTKSKIYISKNEYSYDKIIDLLDATAKKFKAREEEKKKEEIVEQKPIEVKEEIKNERIKEEPKIDISEKKDTDYHDSVEEQVRKEIRKQKLKKLAKKIYGLFIYSLPLIGIVAFTIIGILNLEGIYYFFNCDKNIFNFIIIAAVVIIIYLVMLFIIVDLCSYNYDMFEFKYKRLIPLLIVYVAYTTFLGIGVSKFPTKFLSADDLKIELKRVGGDRAFFELDNNSDLYIESITGHLSAYTDESFIYSGTITFTGGFDANVPSYPYLDIPDIDQYPYALITMNFTLDSVKFTDSKAVLERESINSKFIIKEATLEEYYEEIYLQAVELFEAEEYSQAIELFRKIYAYKDSKYYYNTCDKKVSYTKLYDEALTIAGAELVLPDNFDGRSAYSTVNNKEYIGTAYTSFYCKMVVDEDKHNTFLSDYKTKLLTNGYEVLVENEYETIYKKNDILISISADLDEVSDYMGTTYYAHFYACNIASE